MAEVVEVRSSHTLDMFQRLCQQILPVDGMRGVREREGSRMAPGILYSITGRERL